MTRCQIKKINEKINTTMKLVLGTKKLSYVNVMLPRSASAQAYVLTQNHDKKAKIAINERLLIIGQ
jgi:hypothetical protein